MAELPQPSAWRYTHEDWAGRFIGYQFDTTKPKNPHHPKYAPMFTQGQMNQYGQACFEEGREARELVEPMTEVADRYAHRLALALECVLATGTDRFYNEALEVIGEYRSAMSAIHEQHSPTHMGEPVIEAAKQGAAMNLELIKKEAAKFFPPKRYPFGLAFSQDDVVAFAKHCVDKATGWRKMEDEKPTPNDCKHGVGCLVLRPVTNGKSIELIVDYAWYYAGQFTRQSGRTYKEDGYRDDITHWQPLPQPPKAKNDRLSRQTI